MKMRNFCACLALVGLVALTQQGWAETGADGARVQAQQHFERGMRLVQRERWADAITEFDSSITLYPTQSAELNRALCLRLLGRAPDAVVALEGILDRYGAGVERRRRAEIERELIRLRPRVGRIEIQAGEVQGASVLLDGEAAGSTPLSRPLAVSPGEHRIEVRADGYAPFVRQVTVEGGGEQAIEVALERVVSPGRIRVSLAVPGAQISVDGREVGTSPLAEVVTVPPGEHRVAATMAGYQPGEVRVEVTEGGEAVAELDLAPLSVEAPVEPERPEPERGRRGYRIAAYVLTGLAVAALGAGIGLVAWNGGRYDEWEAEDAELRQAYSSTDTGTQDPAALWGRLQDNAELGDSITSVDGAAWALLGTGIASAVTAVVMYVLGFRSANDGGSESPVALAVRPGGLTLSINWTTW